MTSLNENPLLQIGFRIPFDRIRAEHVEPAIQELIGRAERNVEAIAGVAGARTWANTMAALDTVSLELDTAMSVTRHLEAVSTTPELRAAYNAVEPQTAAFYARIPLHEGLWKAVQEYAATEEAAALTGTRKRYLDKTITYFRRHGAALGPEQKAELEKIDVELAKVATKYSENVLDSTNAFELLIEDEAGLAGLPESAVAMARESAELKGKPGWRFTLQAPSYLAVMTYLDDGAVRERMYRAYQTRASHAPHDNEKNVLRILELRAAKAKMLGYADFADYAIDERMAHNGARAQAFLDDLKAKTSDVFRRENDELDVFRRETAKGAGAARGPAPWDVAYYAEKLRKAKYDLDEEALRPYFALDNVLQGMFELVRRLYGIRVTAHEGAPGWDAAVRFYEVHDEDGAMLGAFYADWYPRENKRGGAWMDAFLTGTPQPEGGWAPHLGLMCGNMTPPSGGKPALLTHREVETVFHEFGHLLHHCLSRVEMRSLAGTNVAWDFVELPSQIMENWCWERPALDLFARHWETGEPLPGDMFDRLKRARAFRAANAQMRQLSFGFVDLALHRVYDAGRDGSVTAYCRRMMNEFSPVPLPEEHAMILSFTHLFSSPVGYAAGYYSYKWAEVLDADAFTAFQREGIFSRRTGMRFRENILARGDSEDPVVLYRAFMGRDPDSRALLQRAGLL